jgi:hypothetical protein
VGESFEEHHISSWSKDIIHATKLMFAHCCRYMISVSTLSGRGLDHFDFLVLQLVLSITQSKKYKFIFELFSVLCWKICSGFCWGHLQKRCLNLPAISFNQELPKHFISMMYLDSLSVVPVLEQCTAFVAKIVVFLFL